MNSVAKRSKGNNEFSGVFPTGGFRGLVSEVFDSEDWTSKMTLLQKEP